MKYRQNEKFGMAAVSRVSTMPLMLRDAITICILSSDILPRYTSFVLVIAYAHYFFVQFN